ncbi:MAG: methyl-accepting chemotaxis protein [Lachnospiraceae bacterium]|nr:methyl-accepting chemotaxis protein [Lachnospiraceae bacterium]
MNIDDKTSNTQDSENMAPNTELGMELLEEVVPESEKKTGSQKKGFFSKKSDKKPKAAKEKKIKESNPADENNEKESKPVKERKAKEPKPVKEKKVKEPKPVKEKPVKQPKPVKEKKVKEPKPVKEKKVREPKPVKEKKVKEPKPVKEKKVRAPKTENSKRMKKSLKGKEISKTNKVSKPKKIRGIKNKLIGAFLLPVILFIIVGIIIYSKSEQGLKSNTETLTFTSVDMLKEYFELGFESVYLTSTRIAVNSDINSHFGGMYDNKYENKAKGAIVNEAVADKYIQAIVAFSENQGNSISDTGVVKKKDLYSAFVNSESGKFVAENMEDSICWISSHPEIDELMSYDSEDYALSLVREILDSNNKPTGYMIIDVKSSFIKDILDNASVGENSIKGFITSDGNEVISGKDSFTFSDKDFFQNIQDKESGYKYVTYKGEQYLFFYNKVAVGDGIVCAMVPKAEIVEKATEIRTYTIITIVACCIIAFIVGSILAMGIAKAINKINEVMKQTAEGDLTGTIVMNRNDEFKLLSGNIGNMIKSIKHLIIKLTGVSEQVQHSAKQVNSNSEVLYKATKDITESIGDIETGLIQQSTDTENCLRQMSDLADRITLVYDSASQIEKIAGITQNTVDDGMVIVKELEGRVQDTTRITKDIIHDISELERESKAINSIIITINEIAEETNLLSLNASIEAARAGEAGRGFAVVSDEIRKLAEQSSKAGTQIGEIISRIQERMGKTIETAEKADDIVRFQAEALGTTVNVFENIKGQVNTLANDLDTISSNIQGIEHAKNDTLEAIASISATSNETEAASTELSKNAEKQMQAVEILYSEVKQLQKNSSELDESVSIFKVGQMEETFEEIANVQGAEAPASGEAADIEEVQTESAMDIIENQVIENQTGSESITDIEGIQSKEEDQL